MKAMAWPLLFASLASFQSASAQNQNGSAVPRSDLAQENLRHVAGSSQEIRAVLTKNPSLIVELKRWLAKDATEHGQMVTDEDLTDQAVKDRLDQDVKFRSIATRLLQRYGYLVPKLNPDSDLAKQQDLLLQARTNQLVLAGQTGTDVGMNLTLGQPCDPDLDEGCSTEQPRVTPLQSEQQLQTRDQQNAPATPCRAPAQGSTSPACAYPSNGQYARVPYNNVPSYGPYPSPYSNPPIGPNGSPNLPQLPVTPQMQQRVGSAQILQTANGASGTGLSALSGQGAGTLLSSLNSSDSDTGNDSSRRLGGLGPGGMSSGSGMLSPLAGMDLQALRDRLSGGNGSNDVGVLQTVPQASGMVTPGQGMSRGHEEDLSRPKVMRVANPYSDIPSLYDIYAQVSPRSPELQRFGQSVFDNSAPTPDLLPMDLPAGPDYVVGPGDGLTISLWGSVSQRLNRNIDREGRVPLPEVGPVLVSGKSLAEVQQTVQEALRSQFRDVSADVSLTRLRTVRVYVVGDVQNPGAYDISSLSTPLNALLSANGPTSQGSLRTVRHYRGKQLVQEADLYELLLHGVRSDVRRLESGDTVQVPPIGPQVTVEGMVRRPAHYELKGEKNLSEALELAGGILPTAALRHIEVQRVVAHEKRTMLDLDLPTGDDPKAVASEFDSFQIQDGDLIHVFPIAPYNDDAVYLQGHVLRPGRYSYKKDMKLTDLISSYNDLLPEPSAQYGEIIRLNPPDFRPSVESFNLSTALAHPERAPALHALDTVRIYSRYDFENAPSVSVLGAVRAPGTYQTSGEVRLSNAIQLAGGLKPDAMTDQAQIFQYLPNGEMKISSVNLEEALSGNPLENIVLHPRDRVLVQRMLAAVDPVSVYVKGEVAKPGRYPLTEGMRVADLIRVAGGMKNNAYPVDADLTRYLVKGSLQATGEHIEVHLADALAGNPDKNFLLSNGDTLGIKELAGWEDIGASVVVKGEVEHPGTYGIRPGERLSSVLQRVGGFLPSAYPSGAVFERGEVRRLQEKSKQELIERIESETATMKVAVQDNPQDQLAMQQAALEQRKRQVEALENTPSTGRMVVRLSSNLGHWKNTSDDIELRAGDTLFIPKRPDFVLVSGQVYNSNAITFVPRKNVAWYLRQAGGPTDQANHKKTFVIRASGAVVSGQGDGWWGGGVMSAQVMPGDTIIVPEKAIGGSTFWKNAMTVATFTQSAALVAVAATR
jgi:protein involved in polysaccharide export with SLBB domain